jgi:hypothetical protein
LNRAIFERIEIGEDGEITDTALTPVYDALSAWQPGLGRPFPAQEGAQAQDDPRTPNVRPSTAPVHELRRFAGWPSRTPLCGDRA